MTETGVCPHTAGQCCRRPGATQAGIYVKWHMMEEATTLTPLLRQLSSGEGRDPYEA